jgi:hypothetical protein
VWLPRQLALNPVGDVTAVDLRLSLWNAELPGTVTTSKGAVTIRAYVYGKRDVLAVAGKVNSGSEKVVGSGSMYTVLGDGQHNSDGTLQVTLACGGDAVITTKGTSPDLTIASSGPNAKRYWSLP